MKFNPTDIKKTSKEMLEKLQGSDFRSWFSTAWSHQQAEIIIAAVAALIVGILLLLIR
jgi:hypothetical protein